MLKIIVRVEDERRDVGDLIRAALEGAGFQVQPIYQPFGPATLAVRTGAPLHPVGCYFQGDGYKVVIGPPLPVPDADSKNEKVVELTQLLARELEEIIARSPEQWHLVVPNWPSDVRDA